MVELILVLLLRFSSRTKKPCILIENDVCREGIAHQSDHGHLVLTYLAVVYLSCYELITIEYMVITWIANELD
jgi:hypothetical protein